MYLRKIFTYIFLPAASSTSKKPVTNRRAKEYRAPCVRATVPDAFTFFHGGWRGVENLAETFMGGLPFGTTSKRAEVRFYDCLYPKSFSLSHDAYRHSPFNSIISLDSSRFRKVDGEKGAP